MTMSFHDWLKSGWLTESKMEQKEIPGLLDAVKRDLQDCKIPGLSLDWSFNIAYNAALQAATAALAAVGYRASRDQHHHRVIQSLLLTIGYDKDLVIRLDKYRQKRITAIYEHPGSVTKFELNDMIEIAEDIYDKTMKWIQREHPDILFK